MGACTRLLLAREDSDPSKIGEYDYFDITPTAIGTAGDEPTPRVGYGLGPYGMGPYGVSQASSTVDVQDITIWSLELWGDDLIANPSTTMGTGAGLLFYWDSSSGISESGDSKTAARATRIVNSPQLCHDVVVLERFIIAIGSGGNRRKVSWCDRENKTSWTASSTNEAGDYELRINGLLQKGITWQSNVLLMTTVEAVVMKYQSSPWIFGFKTIGSGCGLISKNAAVKTGFGIVWMGFGKFHTFDGMYVKELPCDLKDEIENNINLSFAAKIHGANVESLSELHWFYPSSESTDIDRYIIYNYKHGTWATGKMARTAYYYSGLFSNPIGFSKDGGVFIHEKNYSYNDEAGNDLVGDNLPYAESGPIYLNDINAPDDRVTQLIDIDPDISGDTMGVGFRVKTGMDILSNALDDEFVNPSNGQDALRVGSNKSVNIKSTGRYIRLRAEGKNNRPNKWNLGEIKLSYVLRGKR